MIISPIFLHCEISLSVNTLSFKIANINLDLGYLNNCNTMDYDYSFK